MNSSQRAAHNHRRQRNRAAKKKLSSYFESKDMPLTAEAVSSSKPSDIPVILDALNINDALTADEMPGIQNGSDPDISTVLDHAFEENPDMILGSDDEDTDELSTESTDTLSEAAEPLLARDKTIDDVIAQITSEKGLEALDKTISEDIDEIRRQSSVLSNPDSSKAEINEARMLKDSAVYRISKLVENGPDRDVLLASIHADTADKILFAEKGRFEDDVKEAIRSGDYGETATAKAYQHISVPDLVEERGEKYSNFYQNGEKVAEVSNSMFGKRVYLYENGVRTSVGTIDTDDHLGAVHKAVSREFEIPASMIGTPAERYMVGVLMNRGKDDVIPLGETLSVKDLPKHYGYGNISGWGDMNSSTDTVLTFAHARETMNPLMDDVDHEEIGFSSEEMKTFQSYGYVPLTESGDTGLDSDGIDKIFDNANNLSIDYDDSDSIVNELIDRQRKSEILGYHKGGKYLTDYTELLYDDVNQYLNGRKNKNEISQNSHAGIASLMGTAGIVNTKESRDAAWGKNGQLVHRGFNIEEGDNSADTFSSMFKEGAVVQSSGFLSTSTASSQAKTFKSSDGYTMSIVTRQGIPIKAHSAYSEEEEVILPRGSKMRVLSIDEESRTVRLIDEGMYQENIDKWKNGDFNV